MYSIKYKSPILLYNVSVKMRNKFQIRKVSYKCTKFQRHKNKSQYGTKFQKCKVYLYKPITKSKIT